MKNRILTLLMGIAVAFGMQAQEYTTYLFAYFSGNWPDGEQVRYALSDDGYNYQALNYGRPVVASDTIALKRSVRDPHIVRAQDGKTFYMVLTDMRSDMGWQSNDGLILMKSTDLLHWEHTAIHFPTRFPDLEGFDEKNLHSPPRLRNPYHRCRAPAPRSMVIIGRVCTGHGKDSCTLLHARRTGPAQTAGDICQ